MFPSQKPPAFDPSIVKLGEEGNCEFYKRFNDVKGCDPKTGYLVGYGYKYCQKFFQTETKFNEEGKAWTRCVRKKLTNFLIPKYKENKENCDQIKESAFKSHVDIYVDCGFCKIALSNKMALYSTYDKNDFLSITAADQVTKTIGKCLGKPVDYVNDMIKSYYSNIKNSWPF